MFRPVIIAVIVFFQAAALLLAGIATLWWSNDLMLWLIWLVGEEYALGAENVVPVDGGGKLLTNPSAMIAWTTPFWFLGVVQISSAVTLVWLWLTRRRRSTPPT